MKSRLQALVGLLCALQSLQAPNELIRLVHRTLRLHSVEDGLDLPLDHDLPCPLVRVQVSPLHLLADRVESVEDAAQIGFDVIHACFQKRRELVDRVEHCQPPSVSFRSLRKKIWRYNRIDRS